MFYDGKVCLRRSLLLYKDREGNLDNRVPNIAKKSE